MNIVDQISAHVAAVDAAHVLICIDGPAGAGKTTLADALVAVLEDAQVVHMDALYNGWDDALSDDLTYRLVHQIRDPFLDGQPVIYAAYDWYEGAFGITEQLPAARILIVEGVGAAQRRMRERAHLTIFIDIGHDVGRQRVVDRDGTASADHIDAWQRAEAQHFAMNGTADAVDIRLSGEPAS